MSTITKKELFDRVAENTDTRRGVARPIVQSFLDEIIRELVKGNRLEFRDFGVFETRTRAARKARNPKTLKEVQAPAARVVRFKMGRLMKQRVGTPKPRERR
jgi:integration host factor subunit beta